MSKWGATIWNNTDKTGLDSFQVGNPNEQLNQAKEKVSFVINKDQNTFKRKQKASSLVQQHREIMRQIGLKKY